MAKSKRGTQGCCNCLYSGENNLLKYYCGRKAGEPVKVKEKEWLKTDCHKWEYDGRSEGFDADEEYAKMSDNA